MSNPWDHLPNAKHIDTIIASIKAHPKEWEAARYAVRNAARVAARDAVRNAARDAVRNAASSAARVAAWDAAYYTARDAIIALIAYDDCAYMLNSDPGELEIIAKFGNGRAILLLPACKVFAAIKEKEQCKS
jgi:hypothetical protein